MMRYILPITKHKNMKIKNQQKFLFTPLSVAKYNTRIQNTIPEYSIQYQNTEYNTRIQNTIPEYRIQYQDTE